MVLVFGVEVPLIEALFVFSILGMIAFGIAVYLIASAVRMNKRLGVLLARQHEDLSVLETELARQESNVRELEQRYFGRALPSRERIALPHLAEAEAREASIEQRIRERRASLAALKAQLSKAHVDHVTKHELRNFYESGEKPMEGSYICVQCGKQQKIKYGMPLDICGACKNNIFKAVPRYWLAKKLDAIEAEIKKRFKSQMKESGKAVAAAQQEIGRKVRMRKDITGQKLATARQEIEGRFKTQAEKTGQALTLGGREIKGRFKTQMVQAGYTLTKAEHQMILRAEKTLKKMEKRLRKMRKAREKALKVGKEAKKEMKKSEEGVEREIEVARNRIQKNKFLARLQRLHKPEREKEERKIDQPHR